MRLIWNSASKSVPLRTPRTMTLAPCFWANSARRPGHSSASTLGMSATALRTRASFCSGVNIWLRFSALGLTQTQT